MNGNKHGRREKKHHPRCSPELFQQFVAYWENEDTKKVATRNSLNRNSNRGGLGIATHNNGAQTFEASQLGEEPDLLLLMEDTHTNKQTKKVEDKKVLGVLKTVLPKTTEILTQRNQDGEGSSTQLTREEIDQLVIESTPHTKGLPFRLGNLVTPMVSCYVSPLVR